MIKYADLYKEYQDCKVDVDLAIERCLTNSFFINGPEVETFENAWSEYTNSPACAGVSSGTSALMLSLLAVGVKPGDEVIVPSMSFISTAEVASQIGAKPIFVDIDDCYTIDIDKIKNVITKKTSAIIFVDLYGQTIDIEKIKSVAGNIPLIEDAAQAAGCRYKNQSIGNLVDLTCFSFYPGKNLSAIGDAGAVTGRPDLINKIKMLKDHGRTQKYVHEIVGWNERMDALQAAVVAAKIPYLDKWNSIRQRNGAYYADKLAKLPIILPKINNNSTHVYNQFVIQTPFRQELANYLLEHKIETGVQFPLGMHQQPVYKTNIELPVTETLAKHCISLPVHAGCGIDDIYYVCNVINEFYSKLP